MLLWILHVSFQISIVVFSDIYPGVEFWVFLILVFWETSLLFSTAAALIYISPTLYEVSLFSVSLPMFVICVLFDDNNSDRCSVISHFGFWFVVPWWSVLLSIFSCACRLFAFPLWKMHVYVFCPFFNLVFYFFGLELHELFICFILTLFDYYYLIIFSPIQ